MALDLELSRRLLGSVEEGFGVQVAFTRELVRFPSVRGAEQAVQDFVFRALKERGYAMDRFHMGESVLQRHEGAGGFSDKHSRSPIVAGIHRPRAETGRSLILQAHMDVVPPGPVGMWTHPPLTCHDSSPAPHQSTALSRIMPPMTKPPTGHEPKVSNRAPRRATI